MDAPTQSASRASPDVVISRWVNERCPALNTLLSAHDVARLTRRSRWIVLGLVLLRKFPQPCRYRGRPIGWRRADVLQWMANTAPLTHRCRRVSRTPQLSLNLK